MEIITKFAIGDKAWTVRGCKAKEFTVASIHVFESGVVYTAEGIAPQSSIPESQCFATKVELLEYIAADGNESM